MYGEKNKCTAAFTGIWLQKKKNKTMCHIEEQAARTLHFDCTFARSKKSAISKNRLRVHCTLIVHLQKKKNIKCLKCVQEFTEFLPAMSVVFRGYNLRNNTFSVIGSRFLLSWGNAVPCIRKCDICPSNIWTKSS